MDFLADKFCFHFEERKKHKGFLSTLRQSNSQARLKIGEDTFIPPPVAISDEYEEDNKEQSEVGGARVADVALPLDDQLLCSRFGDNMTRILLPNNQVS